MKSFTVFLLIFYLYNLQPCTQQGYEAFNCIFCQGRNNNYCATDPRKEEMTFECHGPNGQCVSLITIFDNEPLFERTCFYGDGSYACDEIDDKFQGREVKACSSCESELCNTDDFSTKNEEILTDPPGQC